MLLVWGLSAFLVVFWISLGVASQSDGDEIAGWILGSPFLLAGLWMAALGRCGVLVSDDGITVVGPLRRRAVAWDQIQRFGVEPHRTWWNGTSGRPSATLRSGEVVLLRGIEPPRRYGGDPPADRLSELAELDAYWRLRR